MSETNIGNAANCVKGYKIFNPDWTCRGKQYECPAAFEEDCELEICHSGMHFCYELKDCYHYYPEANETYHWAEVIAYGDVIDAYPKACTNKLMIVREIPYDEVLREYDNRYNQNHGRFNIGYCNTGALNRGNYNTGDNNLGNCNTHNYNYGNYNSGIGNVGNHNCGNHNIGHINAGDYNLGYSNCDSYNYGDRNSGRFNTGNRNSGDFNNTDGSCGVFNTNLNSKIIMFNKPSDWTFTDWRNSKAYILLDNIMGSGHVKLSHGRQITEEQKTTHPEYKYTYFCLEADHQLKEIQEKWDKLFWDYKKIVMELPNFDPTIFYECTGINVAADWEKFKAGYDEKQE